MAWVRVRDRLTGAQSLKSEGVAKTLRDKYEILSDGVEEGLVENPKETSKVDAPNVTAAPAESVEVAATDELAELRKKYEQVYGGKPHGRTSVESLKKFIAIKENAG